MSFVVAICHTATKVIFSPQEKEKNMHNINKDLLKNVKRSTINTFSISLKGGMTLSESPYKKASKVYQHLMWII